MILMSYMQSIITPFFLIIFRPRIILEYFVSSVEVAFHVTIYPFPWEMYEYLMPIRS